MVVIEAEEEGMVDEGEVLSLVTTAASQGIWPEITLYHLKFTVVTARLRATLWSISLSSFPNRR